jgi:hypothetical protein
MPGTSPGMTVWIYSGRLLHVMAGLVPAIHVFSSFLRSKVVNALQNIDETRKIGYSLTSWT